MPPSHIKTSYLKERYAFEPESIRQFVSANWSVAINNKLTKTSTITIIFFISISCREVYETSLFVSHSITANDVPTWPKAYFFQEAF